MERNKAVSLFLKALVYTKAERLPWWNKPLQSQQRWQICITDTQDAVILGATSVAQKRRCQIGKAVFLKVMPTQKTCILVH